MYIGQNVDHGCRCATPVPQPAPQTKPAQPPAAEPAPTTTAVREATTAMVSQSYYASYMSYAYVSAASQTAAGAGETADGATATTTADAPKTMNLAAMQFGVSVMVAYAAVTQQSVSFGAGGTGEGAVAEEPAGAAPPAVADAPAEEAGEPAVAPAASYTSYYAASTKVLTGTVRPALRPEALPEGSGQGAVAPAPATTTPVAGGADQAGSNADSGQPAVARVETPEFTRFRLKDFSASTESLLKLELQTREGDRVVLDFSQIDALRRTSFRGRDDDGGRVGFKETAESLERLVNIEVTGDISEDERAAIEALFDRVLEVANAFFQGSSRAALDKVRSMDFDTGTLMDFSLQMSQTRNVEALRSYRNDEAGLDKLVARDREVTRSLEYLAESQRTLVSEAKGLLDDRSAAKMVRELLPAMLAEQKQALVSALDDADVADARAAAEAGSVDGADTEKPAAAA